MNPDPKESLPREILEELMEEGAEAFRSVLEKLLNLAMELERGCRSEKALNRTGFSKRNTQVWKGESG